MTKDEFIKKVNEKYGVGNYTVLGDYKNNKNKILIRCNICGHEWSPNAGNFINVCKVGCPKCATKKTHDEQKLSTEEIIKRGKELYGNRYSYNKTDSFNRDEKGRVCFTCNVCGNDFWEKPALFLDADRRKSNCPNCVKIITENNKKEKEERHNFYINNHVYDTESFIKKLNEKFPNFYDTSEVKYVNNITDVILYHNGHKIVTKPSSILGKTKPILQNRVHDTESFIEAAKLVHGDKYIYDEHTVYTRASDDIIIGCKIHGYVMVRAFNHLHGAGCRLCGREKVRLGSVKPFSIFLEDANKKHGGKYTYDESTFVDYSTDMRIICPIHGEFWQKPSVHVSTTPHGCPTCKESSLERNVRIFLQENNIEYQSAKHFKWLGRQHLDFFLPQYNVGIECQGKQHFIDGAWNKENTLNEIVERDNIKFKLCKENNIKILYLLQNAIKKNDIISDEKFKSIYSKNNTFKTISSLFKKIR